MATPFSQTIRAIEHDRPWPVLIGLGITALLALCWAGWFLLASLPHAARGEVVRAQGDGIVVVRIPASAASQLQIGQEVRLHPERAAGGRNRPIEATVAGLHPEGDTTLVDLYAEAGRTDLVAGGEGLTGFLAVELSARTPAALVRDLIRGEDERSPGPGESGERQN